PELLRFPLAAERYANGEAMSWYDPSRDAYRFVCRSENEAIFDARVATFLLHLRADGPSRPEAAVRLLYLHEKGQLTSAQVSSFADSLWKEVPRDGNALPKGTNLLPHAFLIAPAPPDIDAHARVYAHLFGSGEGATPQEMVMSATGREPCMRPSETDAVRLFDKVVGWRPKETDPDSIRDAFSRPAREEADRMMASTLGIVAAPALGRHDRTVGRAEAALTFLEETDLPEVLSALPVFYGLSDDIDRRIESAFRRPLAIGDRRATRAAVDALDRWLHLSATNQVSPPPDVLRDRVLRALEGGRTGGLSRLVYLARRLIEAGRCGSSEIDRIVEVLDELCEETGYGPPIGDADTDSGRAVSLPVIRAECVRLARALEGEGVTAAPVMAWCDLAACDPLPEVRDAARDAKDT
ncbi:MAG: hypothetical protein GX458_05540, partial [Phyllobacteriaceae bacterium]|nr:hypothetical protein [Phyllobacteriaceae bacterium]